MPNFPVTEVPQRISQMLTQPALLQNIGTETIYLDSVSTAGPVSFGLRLQPGSVVNWPADKELWAATAAPTTSSLSVMYNAEGTALSEVSATVSGTINIGTPVNVQGGGEILLDVSSSVASGQTITHTINAPSSGLSYYGLRVNFVNSGLGPNSLNPLVVRVRGNGSVTNDIYASVMDQGGSAGQLGAFGDTSAIVFTTPNTTGYPITILVTNPPGGGLAKAYRLQVDGIAQSFPYPIDGVEWADRDNNRISFNAATAGQFAMIAPSFLDRKFRLSVQAGSSAGRFNIESLERETAVVPNFVLTHTDIQTNWVGAINAVVPVGPGIVANSASEFVIPGNGRPHRVIVNVTVVGSCGLEYMGRVST